MSERQVVIELELRQIQPICLHQSYADELVHQVFDRCVATDIKLAGLRSTLEAALELDARLAYYFLTGDELYEGIRSLLIDKDGKPKWPHSTLKEVSDRHLTVSGRIR